MCKTVAENNNCYDRVLWETVMKILLETEILYVHQIIKSCYAAVTKCGTQKLEQNVGDVGLLIQTDQQIQAYDERNIINFIFILSFFVVWNIQQIYTIRIRGVFQTTVQSRLFHWHSGVF